MKKNIFTSKETLAYPYILFFSYSFNGSIHIFRYHRNSVEKYISSRSLEMAKIKVIEFCAKLKQYNGDIPKEQNFTFEEFGIKWLDVFKKPYINKDTYRTYKCVFTNYIAPRFGHCYFSEISITDLQLFFNNLPQDKGKTRETIKIVLRGIYTLACNEELISHNLMEHINVKRHIRKKGKCLEKFEEKTFLDSIKGNPKELAWLIMLYSGVRPSELQTIIFNWQDNIMTIKNGKLKESQKEYVFRKIPIFPLLKTLKARINNERWQYSAFELSRNFPKYCPNYRLYDLRHTFITRTKECGVIDELVSLWTGHELGNTVTAKVYTHYNIDFQQNEAKKIIYTL